eukprot:TRINITY_DN1547_c1_g1_i2.p1 TRINITY_DN1547_c1_g1~~TRINITY_DN1547_c1_g1_i2.p1  ORF type:complete len:290 (+),score=48.10 TRINITY_DN1547_c1_g1_i2:122-991(+)
MSILYLSWTKQDLYVVIITTSNTDSYHIYIRTYIYIYTMGGHGEKKKEERMIFRKDADSPPYPIPIGAKCMVEWRDKSGHYLAEIIECKLKNKDKPEDPNSWEFYVHYVDYNRRMDEWTRYHRIDEEHVKTVVAKQIEDYKAKMKAKEEAKAKARAEGKEGVEEDGDKKKKVMKRKRDGADIDPALAAIERDREERTRVKNVTTVEFGRYEIDCWYFSPYPTEFDLDNGTLHICEFCLTYFRRRSQLVRHTVRNPSLVSLPLALALSLFLSLSLSLSLYHLCSLYLDQV